MMTEWSCRWRRWRTTSCLLLALALHAAPADAGTPEWLRAVARTTLPKYAEETAAAVVLSERTTTLKDNGEIKTTVRRAYKILRPEGRKFATVAVFFDSETRLTYLKGWSIGPQGAEFEAKEADAIERSVFDGVLYQDTRYKLLTIPGGQPGSIVGYEYQQKGRPMILQDIWRLQEEVPVRHSEFILELPSGWEYETQWLNHAPVEPRAAGANRWSWELDEVPAVEMEPSMPAWRSVAAQLALTYYPAKPGTSLPQRSWRDVGQWYSQLAADRTEITPEIRKKVAELTGPATTPIAKIRNLATYTQNVRYVAIEIGIGGYQPHAAGDVLTNQYGDCKDKVTLLRAMLKQIGVDSFYVLVNSRRGVLAPKFPSPLSFDHVILALRLPDDVPEGALYSLATDTRLGRLLFFDPTDSFTPLGYLPPALQASYGLVVSERGGELMALPLLKPATNRLYRSAKLNLSDSGALSGEVHEIRWGSPATDLRATLLPASASERVKYLESFLSRSLRGAQFTGATIGGLPALDQNLELYYRFSAEHYAEKAGDLFLLRPRVLGEKGSTVLEGKPRKHPVEFPEATLQTDTFEIALPAGYQTDELPPAVQVDYPFGEYRSSVEMAGNVLRYSRTYQIKDVKVTQERMDDLKKFFAQIAEDERATAILRRVGR